MIQKNLSVLAYANSFTLWIYKAETVEELHDAMSTPGFFSSEVRAGDVLYISLGDQYIAQMRTVAGEDGQLKLATLGGLRPKPKAEGETA